MKLLEREKRQKVKFKYRNNGNYLLLYLMSTKEAIKNSQAKYIFCIRF